MKRAFIAVLLSGLVLPGLGQLYTGRLRRGGLLIAAMSLLVMALLAAFFLSLNRAAAALSDQLPPAGERLSLLAKTLASQNQTGLIIVLGLMLACWIFGVIDAWRGGRPRAGGESL